MRTRWGSGPSDAESWDALCALEGNAVQETAFSQVQHYFANTRQIFVEVLSEEQRLIGGVRLALYQSTRLGGLAGLFTRALSQLGEFFIHPEYQHRGPEIKGKLMDSLFRIARERRAVTFSASGIYGGLDRLLLPEMKPSKLFDFNASYVPIDKGLPEIEASFNRRTKRSLRKATETGLIFEPATIDGFLDVLRAVYAQQSDGKPPDYDYIRFAHSVLSPRGKVATHMVRQQERALSCSLFLKAGARVYSWFGGAIKNDVGAGHLNYLELMKIYKAQGVERFYFGQVANDQTDQSLNKFANISDFKRGFGLVEAPSCSATYVLSPRKKQIWNLILRGLRKP